MSNIAVKEKEIEEVSDNVESMIYEINGTQVMLDSEISVTKWHAIKSLIYLTLRVLIKLMLFYQYWIST